MNHQIINKAFIVALFAALFSSFASAQQTSTDVPPVITIPLHQQFSEIVIEDITGKDFAIVYGYPGIWIERTDDSWASVSYNEICEKYIYFEIENGILKLKVNINFLNPYNTKWRRDWGCINPITIRVPKKYSISSITNTGWYYTNVSLINFKQKSLIICASNTTNMILCDINSLIWRPYDGQPMAPKCASYITLDSTIIKTLDIPASFSNTFKLELKKDAKIESFKYSSVK
ncbi:MAG: hypothetical protein K2J74_04810 [Muribaculaceae bacterium]|nr:hypothetical protein [Muribaculaceae bacterium]